MYFNYEDRWRTVISAKTYQFLFHNADQPSNAIIIFKTDFNSLFCLLEIGQSTSPNLTPLPPSNNHTFILNILKYRNFPTLIIQNLNQES